MEEKREPRDPRNPWRSDISEEDIGKLHNPTPLSTCGGGENSR